MSRPLMNGSWLIVHWKQGDFSTLLYFQYFEEQIIEPLLEKAVNMFSNMQKKLQQ